MEGGGRGATVWVLMPKRARAVSNIENWTKFTNCEFKSKILWRPSSQDDNPSWRRYFSSLRTRSIMRSTSSLASMAQWSKSPILTQDFTILPWISMRPVARANFLALELLIRYEQRGTNGSLELPSSQYISISYCNNSLFPRGKRRDCAKKCKESYPFQAKLHNTSVYW